MSDLKKLAFSREYLLQCSGYSPSFIDDNVNISLDKVLSRPLKQCLPEVEGNPKGVLNYCDLSVLYNAERRVPFVAAYNIDGTASTNQAARPTFRADPRIEKDIQLNQDFYNLRTDITEFEIGHMASNNEMGRGENGKVKAYQTFHFTNSVPQAEVLNSGMWQGLESYIIKEAATIDDNKRICVFTGPVLTDKDPSYVEEPSFKIPLLFYKVIVFSAPTGVYSTAFMISHEKRLIEHRMFKVPVRRLRGFRQEVGYFNDYPYRKVFQVNIPMLEDLSGLKFTWPGVQKVEVPEGKKQVEVIRGIRDAEEARAAIRRRRGLARAHMSRDLTSRELKAGDYKLNISLP